MLTNNDFYIKQLTRYNLLAFTINMLTGDLPVDVKKANAEDFVIDAWRIFLTKCQAKDEYWSLWQTKDLKESKLQIIRIMKNIIRNKVSEHLRSKKGFFKGQQGFYQKDIKDFENLDKLSIRLIPTLPDIETLLTRLKAYFSHKKLKNKDRKFLIHHLEGVLADLDKGTLTAQWNVLQSSSISVASYEKKLTRLRKKLAQAGVSRSDLLKNM